MSDKKYVISETGEVPPHSKVHCLGDDEIYRPVFGPDPDLSDAQRKCDEMNGERARDDDGHFVADDLSTPDVNEAYVGGKAPRKKAAKKKVAKKKVAKKKASKKRK